ncbi:hypothetical protein [uncultured Cohaesibacter sp.]|uniref:hypothetical protein n=1 Tax=uncultured Cohaesibacter sp. TaxID=1002546 RepID=UPI0029C83AEE|nr:hypothetical protein [uncultured Cohaesibacter sp.]
MPEENALHRALGRIEGKQDLILTNVDRLTKDHAALRDSVDILDGRVTKVEKKLVWWAGAFATVSSLAYFFRSKIAEIFS